MNISINKPCHEDWEKMSPNEQGVFCNVCTKNVVDFTSKTLEEIKSFFSKPKEGSVCGRFKEEQLDTLSLESFLERFVGFKAARKVAMIVALTFVAWLAGINEGRAQSDVKGKVAMDPPTVTTQTVTPPTKVGIIALPKDTTKCVKEPKKPKGTTKAQPAKKPKEKSTTASLNSKGKEEKMIMGDVAP